MNEKYIDKLFKLCSGEPLLWREVDGMIKQAMQRQREACAAAYRKATYDFCMEFDGFVDTENEEIFIKAIRAAEVEDD